MATGRPQGGVVPYFVFVGATRTMEAGMGDLIHRTDLAKYRQKVEDYYEHVQGLRAAGNLDSVVGVPFIYRPDGSGVTDVDQHYCIWNMRHSVPVQTFKFANDSRTLTLLGKLHTDDVPSEFPDVGESVISDVPVDEFFKNIIDGVEGNWDQEPTRRVFKNATAMLGQTIQNLCVGDIPWSVFEATAKIRKERMWDQHDLPGNPWVMVDESTLCIKTERMQHVASAIMSKIDLPFTVLYEGDPAGPGSEPKGVYHA